MAQREKIVPIFQTSSLPMKALNLSEATIIEFEYKIESGNFASLVLDLKISHLGYIVSHATKKLLYFGFF
jgi:hypothetical protein